MQVLAWIAGANQALTTIELQHALAVEIGQSYLDGKNIPEVEDMVSVCAGLVTVDEQSSIVRLVHYTTQMLFDQIWTEWFPNMHQETAVICITYLSFNVFEAGFYSTDQEFEARLRQYPLYTYASRYWGFHYGCTQEMDNDSGLGR